MKIIYYVISTYIVEDIFFFEKQRIARCRYSWFNEYTLSIEVSTSYHKIIFDQVLCPHLAIRSHSPRLHD